MKFVVPHTDEEFEKYFYIRWETLRKEWNQPRGSEIDDQEKDSFHGMITDDSDHVLAVSRLNRIAPGKAQIRYMGVAESHRGKGIGSLLLKNMERIATENELHHIMLQARENAVPFYLSNGYKIVKKTFLLFNEIQHFEMEKQLNQD